MRLTSFIFLMVVMVSSFSDTVEGENEIRVRMLPHEAWESFKVDSTTGESVKLLLKSYFQINGMPFMLERDIGGLGVVPHSDFTTLMVTEDFSTYLANYPEWDLVEEQWDLGLSESIYLGKMEALEVQGEDGRIYSSGVVVVDPSIRVEIKSKRGLPQPIGMDESCGVLGICWGRRMRNSALIIESLGLGRSATLNSDIMLSKDKGAWVDRWGEPY